MADFAPRLGPGPSVPESLIDDLAFELGEGGEDMEKQSSLCTARVDIVLDADKLFADSTQVVDPGDQVLNRSPEAIELSDDHAVDTVALDCSHHKIELGPLINRAHTFINEEGESVSFPLTEFLDHLFLGWDALLDLGPGADAAVAEKIHGDYMIAYSSEIVK